MEDGLPPAQGERHVLKAEEELRLEVSFQKQGTCQLLLQKGSCELQGVELASGKPVILTDGGLKLALFTWHGCVIDVLCDNIEISYTSDETNCNVAYINTHAQLEAIRDEAASTNNNSSTTTNNSTAGAHQQSSQQTQGPRVLIVGPAESGKTSLTKLLVAYATKLGRTPMAVDLDPSENAYTVPGALAAVPMDRDSMSVESQALSGVATGTAAPLVLWHGSTTLSSSSDLFRAQVAALGRKIDRRLKDDDWARSSGIIVNTNSYLTQQGEGYQLLLHTVEALKISVVLVLGHDRLYSMLKSSLKETTAEGAAVSNAASGSTAIKIIKVPRSGGVVSRDAAFLRLSRSRSVKRYFYGETVEGSTSAASGGGGAGSSGTNSSSNNASNSSNNANNSSNRVAQLTPFLLQLPFGKLTVYKYASISLSESLLPVAAAQATDPVQVEPVTITEQFQHSILAVCHPQAVAAYEASGRARDLYESGVAGFVAVERVVMEGEILHLLSPCAGSLPSHTLLTGDITWVE